MTWPLPVSLRASWWPHVLAVSEALGKSCHLSWVSKLEPDCSRCRLERNLFVTQVVNSILLYCSFWISQWLNLKIKRGKSLTYNLFFDYALDHLQLLHESTTVTMSMRTNLPSVSYNNGGMSVLRTEQCLCRDGLAFISNNQTCKQIRHVEGLV